MSNHFNNLYFNLVLHIYIISSH